ncbi:ras-related protein Rab-34 isoform X1 [Tamandua tetradactyla]|uniref:ras-related protein Rab-34 isoform X1 n=1 Tax=Tamandua tetradactyla TaxID=48850 RepID=UPI0040541DFA
MCSDLWLGPAAHRNQLPASEKNFCGQKSKWEQNSMSHVLAQELRREAPPPRCPFFPLFPPRRLLASPDAAQQPRIPHHQFSWGIPLGRRQDEHPGSGAKGPRPGRAAPDLRSPRSLWWGTCRWGRLASLIGSAKTLLIRITRPPLEWTLRWNDLRCWAFPSVFSSIIIVFNLNDVASLEHTKQWLADALKENDPSSVLLFLVGSKKDLSTPAQYSLMEKDALKVAQEMKAEYWAVSSLTGENVREFFFRVAALTFEANVLAELEKSGARRIGDVVRINSDDSNLYLTASKKKPTCCP